MALPKISSLILLLASAILIVVSLATDFWVTGPGAHFGLWKFCTSSRVCEKLGSAASIDSTRAFVIISFLLLLVAVALQIKENCISGPSMTVNAQKLTAIIAFCAGASAIIAMSIFTGYGGSSPGLGVQYSWSYGLGWASAALSMVAAIVAYQSFNQEA